MRLLVVANISSRVPNIHTVNDEVKPTKSKFVRVRSKNTKVYIEMNPASIRAIR
jgi:hypothetical protein